MRNAEAFSYHTSNPRRRAFTLVELLVALSVIAILAALGLTGIRSSMHAVRRTACVSNLRQLGIASLLYAEDASGWLSNTRDDADDDQNWLFPNYAAAPGVFRCPATRNRVREDVFALQTPSGKRVLTDLLRYAGDRLGYGSSYEVYGFMNPLPKQESDSGGNHHGIRKTVVTVQSYVHKSKAFGLQGQLFGPSEICLLLDGDRSFGNMPSETSNHGRKGLNVQFCDGHVEWVKAASWPLRYEMSQDENRVIR